METLFFENVKRGGQSEFKGGFDLELFFFEPGKVPPVSPRANPATKTGVRWDSSTMRSCG